MFCSARTAWHSIPSERLAEAQFRSYALRSIWNQGNQVIIGEICVIGSAGKYIHRTDNIEY
jgi:hypothetical protein